MIYQNTLAEEGSAHRAQLNKGFAALRFEHLLEGEFRTSLADTRLRQLRVSLVILAVAAIGLPLIDLGDSQVRAPGVLLLVHTFINLTLILALLAVCHGRFGKHMLEPLQLALAFAVGPLGLCVDQLAGTDAGLRTPLVTAVTSTLFIYFCFGLRFWHAVAMNSLLLVVHAALMLQHGGEVTASLYTLLLLWVPSALSALVAYHLEYNERQRYLMEWELKFQANHDQLTGLWNRRALHEHLARTWAHCNREQQRLSLAFIDIDYFKNFNDTYGHVKGDQCLAEIGRLLCGIAQRPLDLVARYGGEEFAVLLPNCSATQAERIMRQFQDKLAERHIPNQSSRIAPHLTVSIGLVSVVPRQASVDFNRLMSSADKALYEAKSRGRNCLVANNQLEPVQANDRRDLPVVAARPMSRIAC